MSKDQDEVPEEYFGNDATDVEAEDDTSGGSDADPWNPDLIRIHTKSYSLRHITDMIKDGEIDLAPDFQRQYVWKDAQRSGLIESILLGIPLPSFYFNEDKNGALQVVDGVQRITTIDLFTRDTFALGDVVYLKTLRGTVWSGLDPILRRRFQSTQIVVHVIDPQTPYRVKFDIFRRINTGGTPLSAQEIRHCMSHERSRGFLRDIVKMPVFRDVMGSKVVNHPRMAANEIALRLVAFHISTVEDYQRFASLDAFLGSVTEMLDDRSKISDARLEELKTLAERALTNAKTALGEYAFRKRYPGSDRRNPINRTLVESWGKVFAEADPRVVLARKFDLELAARRLFADATFANSISGSTGDSGKVRTRMDMVRATVEAVLA